jgi:hypothetical protein
MKPSRIKLETVRTETNRYYKRTIASRSNFSNKTRPSYGADRRNISRPCRLPTATLSDLFGPLGGEGLCSEPSRMSYRARIEANELFLFL